MNFEFLKNLRGLSYIYENCSNAEKLAITMPMQSVITSRKSAELLAKFIYLAAHNQDMADLSFADILSDITVRKFINSRTVMDAFHYIRKCGNRAVHGNDQESSEDAITVLEDLHYVAGETACILGLIDDYPTFEDQIKEFPNAQYYDEEDIQRKARNMFLQYVEAFDAQAERDRYLSMQDYDWLSYSIEGIVEMHEYLEFKSFPKHKTLIEYIQNYLGTLLRLSIERSPEKTVRADDVVALDAKLMIDGKSYLSSDTKAFEVALTEKLPKATTVIVDCICNGNLREYFNDESNENGDGRVNMILKESVWTGSGMLDMLQSYKRRNSFIYKLSIFYPNSGESYYGKILNGREIDVIASGTPDIIEKESDEEWWSWDLHLWADFDYEKHPDVLSRLKTIIRRMLPETEVPYCEELWEEGNSCALCCGIQWNCKSLKDVQAFLDEINKELLPIRDEVDAGGSGTWEIRKEFAVATWTWTEAGFKILGTCY